MILIIIMDLDTFFDLIYIYSIHIEASIYIIIL